MSNNLSSTLARLSTDIENKIKSYQADQQVKYLHLEAEIDMLHHKIQQQLNNQVSKIDKIR